MTSKFESEAPGLEEHLDLVQRGVCVCVCVCVCATFHHKPPAPMGVQAPQTEAMGR